MKIRKGFVTNSSSSSCIIIGNVVEPEEIDEYTGLILIGGYLNEGKDVFTVNHYQSEAVKDIATAFPAAFGKGTGHKYTLVDGCWVDDEYGDGFISKEELRDIAFGDGDAYCVACHADYGSGGDSGDIYERYEKEFIEDSLKGISSDGEPGSAFKIVGRLRKANAFDMFNALLATGVNPREAARIALETKESKNESNK